MNSLIEYWIKKEAAFKSKAQRRKFYALKALGKMDQKTINEWESTTPKKIPEKVANERSRYLKQVGKKQDKDGWYVTTHRARSKSYASIKDIPISRLKFIASTG